MRMAPHLHVFLQDGMPCIQKALFKSVLSVESSIQTKYVNASITRVKFQLSCSLEEIQLMFLCVNITNNNIVSFL